MISGRQILYLTISIVVVLAVYLYDVDRERKESVKRFFPSPQVGDVYKMKRDEDDGKSWVHHLKVKEINDSGLVFTSGKRATDVSSDLLLNQYNAVSSLSYTYRELREIKDGKWKNWQKNNTEIIEIKRRNK